MSEVRVLPGGTTVQAEGRCPDFRTQRARGGGEAAASAEPSQCGGHEAVMVPRGNMGGGEPSESSN